MPNLNLAAIPDLPALIATRLQRSAPGRSAQERFAPELCYGRHFGPPSCGARRAAVIALLYPHDGEWMVPLTQRSVHLKAHAGQISLPGGATHTDESPQEAARRELEEELGVRQNEVRILGELSTIYLFASDFVVTPYIAAVPKRPDFRPDPNEVAELIEVSLSSLLDPKNVHRQIRRIGRRRPTLEYEAPYIAIDKHRIWGATAVLLGEFLAVIEELAFFE